VGLWWKKGNVAFPKANRSDLKRLSEKAQERKKKEEKGG